MSNVFKDQYKFMKSCDQSVTGDDQQFDMYLNLIKEEYNELLVAQGLDADHNRVGPADPVETLDALIDILVVTIGALHSMGADAEGAWKEVMRSNFSKVGEDGKVRKREDGKVLKPLTYSPPELAPFVTKSA